MIEKKTIETNKNIPVCTLVHKKGWKGQESEGELGKRTREKVVGHRTDEGTMLGKYLQLFLLINSSIVIIKCIHV